MKARIKKTGDIVEIASFYSVLGKVTVQHDDGHRDDYRPEELEFVVENTTNGQERRDF